MKFPDYAIIVTPTLEERKEILAFLDDHGYKWSGDHSSLRLTDHWWLYKEDGAVNIYPDKSVCHWDIGSYQDDNSRRADWYPKDERFVLCSVDEFISLCSEENLNFDFDFENIESLL